MEKAGGAPAHYAALEDIEQLWRPLSASERTRATALLPVVEASLRTAARQTGRDLDVMAAEDPDLAETARSVTVDVTVRALMTATDGEPVTQMTQTAGPYSVSGTFLVPGGGLFIKKSELARLGLRRQRYGVIEPYALSEGHPGDFI